MWPALKIFSLVKTNESVAACRQGRKLQRDKLLESALENKGRAGERQPKEILNKNTTNANAFTHCCSSHVAVLQSLKYKYMLWGAHYRNLNVKTEHLWPQASLNQQLEFHWAADDGETQETGDGLDVCEVYTMQQGFCGDSRNVPASMRLKALWCDSVTSRMRPKFNISWDILNKPMFHQNSFKKLLLWFAVFWSSFLSLLHFWDF